MLHSMMTPLLARVDARQNRRPLSHLRLDPRKKSAAPTRLPNPRSASKMKRGSAREPRANKMMTMTMYKTLKRTWTSLPAKRKRKRRGDSVTLCAGPSSAKVAMTRRNLDKKKKNTTDTISLQCVPDVWLESAFHIH